MNELSPHQRFDTHEAGKLRQVAAWLFLLYLVGCMCGSVVAAQDDLDGNYRGNITLSGVGYGSGRCLETNLEQVMLVMRGQVYLDRKSLNQGATLLLSGTVDADGKVSATGVTESQSGYSPTPRQVIASLTGKIQNGQFIGTLDQRPCNYNVTLRK